MAPHPSRGLTSVALLRTVCLCARLNNLTRAIPPLLLCLITPCTLSVLSRGRKRDRIDFKQHLGGAGGRRGGQGWNEDGRGGGENWGEGSRENERTEWRVGAGSSIDVVQISEGLVDPQWAQSCCSPFHNSQWWSGSFFNELREKKGHACVHLQPFILKIGSIC